MSVLRKLETLRRQSSAVLWRLPTAVLALTWVAVLLRVRGFARAQRQLSRSAARACEGVLEASDPARAVSLARPHAVAVNLAARNLPGKPRCLTRSLSLWWLLRRRGIDSRMCVGVRQLSGEIEAHAWVACGEHVINDHQDIALVFLPFDGDIAAIVDSIQVSFRRAGDEVDPLRGIE